MILRQALNILTILWYASIAALLIFGWTISDERYMVAESGTGYWLGIIGGSMMLLLLLYPVRKKNPKWQYVGSVKFWFRMHMFFGVVGPVLVIFHSGFRLGSLNGQVAMFSMLLVATSGFAGRYLYRQMHHGLYGEKIHHEELYPQDEMFHKRTARLRELHPEIMDELQEMEKILITHHTGINRSITFYLSYRWKLRQLRKRLTAILPKSKKRKEFLKRIWNLRSICNLGINEILFSYWHVFHYPLFLIMIFSAFVHVGVVHFY
jgi:hypothetical protein